MTDHMIDIVNDKDEIIGQDIKSQKIAKGFISRVVAIFIIRTNGKLIICKRADDKKSAANLYDLAACGNVMQGESYLNAAERELKEELNITCTLKPLEKLYQEVHNDGKIYKIFCGIFIGMTDDTIQLNEEVVEAKEMDRKELEKELDEHPENFCPGFISDYTQVKDQLANMYNF